MEVIEIDKTKLIFLLDRKDMTKYSIDTAVGSPSLRDGFSRIVSDTNVDRGFLSRVLVQIFDLENGGCEMFVTKIPDSADLGEHEETTKKNYIYIFTYMQDLLSACRMLQGINEAGGSAYVDRRQNNYYLSLTNECRYLGEFGAVRCKSSAQEYLTEHCRLITDDAIGKLSSLA